MRILNLLKLFVTIRCFSVKRDTLSAKIVLNREISKRTARPIILEIQKNRCLMCNQKFNRMVPHEMITWITIEIMIHYIILQLYAQIAMLLTIVII